MSKIPQGEWNAIAARYAQGESISRIAQSYGCTPPAIHYILKRNKQRTAQRAWHPPSALPGTALAPAQSTMHVGSALDSPPLSGARGDELRTASQIPAENVRTPMEPVQLRPGPDRRLAPVRQMPSERIEPHSPLAPPSSPPLTAGRASAFTAGLDSELHDRAEAAVAAFLSSFDAALAEGSPHLRKRLRDAATDLMRVAARTTIVLDRLNASAEHASRRGEGQLL